MPYCINSDCDLNYLREDTHHPWPCLTRISSRPLDFLTPERLTLFQNWIRTCREGHPNCKNSGDTATPKRLLRVERSKNWELSLDEDIQQNPSYVTLSHRWNVSLADSIKTTRDNIAERRSKISWEILPKTIQDAITVTRWLGVSHLWIDSLCIIQDDSQDRNEQIARMGDIYAGSLVTLASHFDPSESGSSADGLFLNRKHVQDVVQLDHEGNTFSTYIVDQTFHNIIMPGSLTSRAWSLQERLLSPRVLHFRKGETIFECFSSSRCECKPDGFPKDADVHLPVEVWSQNRHIDTTLKLDMANGILHAKDHNEERCWSYWHRVIAAYTGADLTRVEDTLPTLSGIAHRMPRELFGRYIAGLWTNKLPYELLWQHDNGCGRKRSRYVPYVAPSWSWTCLSGTSRLDYHWFDSEVVRVAEVLHADTTLASHDPMGAVTAGFINVKAHAKLVKPSQFGYWDDIKSTILYDGWWIYPSLDTQDDESRYVSQDIYAIEILTRRRTVGINNGGETVSSRTDVILITPSEKIVHAYERIGLALIYRHDGLEDFFAGNEVRCLTIV